MHPFFLLIEALALIAVPAIITVCLKLIRDDATQERNRRRAALDEAIARARELQGRSYETFIKARDEFERAYTGRQEEVVGSRYFKALHPQDQDSDNIVLGALKRRYAVSSVEPRNRTEPEPQDQLWRH